RAGCESERGPPDGRRRDHQPKGGGSPRVFLISTSAPDLDERLAALHGRSLNFEPERLGDGPGWEHDDCRQPLASELPGPPQPGGSWEVAVALSRSYAFADPALVEARYDPRVPLEQREMLLIL